ncbi:uncharacterized protein [Aegilops tauschii subsp. strangulata]|uniref:uncharacterized protein isoform X2 n=1 Tax=Aegilops tauschii subsp. strangulata TaxID=200361 RepID=UPI003CC86D3C
MAFVRSPSFFSYCLLRPPSRRSADCIEAVRLLLHLRWLAAVLVVLLGSGWKSCSASASAPVACCCYSRLHPVLPFQFKVFRPHPSLREEILQELLFLMVKQNA